MSSDNTKDKILSVASKLFSRYGFHKTSMDEIAKIARKAKGSLYYHFSSKEELFKEVVAVEIENLKSNLSLIVIDNKMRADEKLRNYLITRMKVLNDAQNYHETLRADFYEHFEFVDDLRKELDKWEIIQLKNIFTQGVKEGIFSNEGMDNIDIFLEVFIMIFKGLEINFYLQDKYEKYEPYSEEFIRILIKGISP